MIYSFTSFGKAIGVALNKGRRVNNQLPPFVFVNLKAEFGGVVGMLIKMKKVIIFISLILCINCTWGKNLNPITPEGVKTVEVIDGSSRKVANIRNQIDKNEKNQVKTLKFKGFNGYTLPLEEKDNKEIQNLPNLTAIEVELHPDDFYGDGTNVILLGEYPNVKTLIFDIFDENGKNIDNPSIISLFDFGDQESIARRISKQMRLFPNLQNVILKYGPVSSIPEYFDDKEYAVYLNPKYFQNQDSNDIGIWGAYANPEQGIIKLVRNQLPDYNNSPTIIPSYSSLKFEDFKITENIKYIGRWAFDLKIKNIEILPSDSPILVRQFKRSSNKTEIDRPILILQDFNLGYGKENSITFKKPVYLNTSFEGDPGEVKFENLVIAPLTAFENIKYLSFSEIPQIENSNDNIEWGDCIIEIPDGKLNEFIALGFPKSCINSISSAPITITVKEPNTILSYLSPDKLKEVEDLTVIGFLYDTDIKILSECTNLKKLDLSRCIITVSPQTQKERQQEAEAMSALFGFINQQAQQKYQDWEISRESAEFTSMLSALADMDLKNVNKGVDDCGVPGGAFKNLKFLKSVKLPLTATYIGGNAFSGCSALTEVELPPYLKKVFIGAFDNSGITYIKLPASVESLSDYENGRCAFGNCSNLNLLDAGDCEFSKDHNGQITWRDPIYKCKKLILPKNIERIQNLTLPEGSELYCPSTLKEFPSEPLRYITIHAQSKEAPSGYIHDCTVYVPKGGMTSWYAKFGKNNKIIEEP